MLRNNANVRRCSYFELGLPVVYLKAESNNCFIIHWKYFELQNMLSNKVVVFITFACSSEVSVYEGMFISRFSSYCGKLL